MADGWEKEHTFRNPSEGGHLETTSDEAYAPAEQK